MTHRILLSGKKKRHGMEPAEDAGEMEKKERYHLLDGLRGITLISMILYHGMFDLVELYGVSVGWFWKTPGYVWQQSICWMFILLSGFCWRLGSAPLKRGLIISACGMVITAVTYCFMPSERILFGILTFTGAAMVSLVPFSGLLERLPAWAGFLGSGALFFLTRDVNSGYLGFEKILLGRVPEGLYRGICMTALGFPELGFFSGDYFSYIPWIFLYLCGYFLYGILMEREAVRSFLGRRVGLPGWIGRHSLPVYMLHQPVLMLILECIF